MKIISPNLRKLNSANATILLNSLVLIILFASMLVSAEQKEKFIWVIFLFPFLWLLWFFCIFSKKKYKFSIDIIFIWIIINVNILLFVLSYSGFSNWKHSKDGDIVIMIVYFPIIALPLFLFRNVQDFLNNLISDGVNSLAVLLGGGMYSYFFALFTFLAILSIFEGFLINYTVLMSIKLIKKYIFKVHVDN